MTKFIRNNQKKLLAVFGVFLMISFVASTGTGRAGSGNEMTVGTYDHGKMKLGANEYRNLSSQWSYLKDKNQFGPIVVATVLGGGHSLGEEQIIEAMTDPNQLQFLQRFRDQLLGMQGRFGDLARAEAIGERIYAQIEDKRDMFALLVKDAEMQGVGVNSDLIESIIAGRKITKETDPTAYENLKISLRSLFLVSNAADRATSVVKVSRPEIANSMASRFQQMSVNVLEFNAKDFLGKVPAPTAQQLQEQFDKYKSAMPGSGGISFGYKYPNRVMYDAIEIRRDDVKKGVAPIEPEDAALYYSQHKASFHASTMPTTSSFTDISIDRGPTTRQMSYEESKPKIIQTLTDQRTDELWEKVRDAVRDTMKADYDAYKAAMDAKATTAPSSLGVMYTDSKGYIAKLKAKILADFKVDLRNESAEGWRTPTMLAESTQGKDSFATLEMGASFSTYMTNMVDVLMTDENKQKLALARGERKPIAVWEPTPVFENGKRDAFLIARATKAEASHVPATLDEVKDKVTEDVKLAAANDLAKKAAQTALEAAKTKWLYTVAAEQGRKAFTTGVFGANDGMGNLLVPGYDLKGEAVSDFKKGAVKLLAAGPRIGQGLKPATMPAEVKATTQPTTKSTTQAATQPTTKAVAAATTMPTSAPVVAKFNDHPVGIIELPSEGKVVVAELEELKPLWTKDQAAASDSLVANQERTSTETVLRLQWFSYDQLIKRMDYTPTEKREPKDNKPLPSDNPFGG